MSLWTVAAVQMDCLLGQPSANLSRMRTHLRAAAAQGARLVVFPECALTGYGFEEKEEGWPHAETIPGPATRAIAEECQALGVFVAFGLLEQAEGGQLYNACALLGPQGLLGSYRKIHLPFLGIDRFTTPGNRPFAVHDLGGLRVGLNICYDCSFPESSRVLTLLGADLIILPTNWPTGARTTACTLPQARALENHVYFVAVNRVGEESGFRFIGASRVLDPAGETMAVAGEEEEILLATIDPERARRKRVIVVPGKHEVNRVGDRRPEMYGPLVQTGIS